MFADLKKSSIISSIIYIIAGILLVVFSRAVANAIWYIFAGVLIVFGIIKTIEYFSTPADKNFFGLTLVIGLVCVAFGIYIFVSVDTFRTLIPVIFGIIGFIAALVKLQQSIDLCRSGYKKWWTVFVAAIILGVFAALIFSNLGEASNLPIIFMGILFFINGIVELWATSRMSKIIKDAEQTTVVLENSEQK